MGINDYYLIRRDVRIYHVTNTEFLFIWQQFMVDLTRLLINAPGLLMGINKRI